MRIVLGVCLSLLAAGCAHTGMASPMLRTMTALQQPVIREPAVEVLELLSDEARTPRAP